MEKREQVFRYIVSLTLASILLSVLPAVVLAAAPDVEDLRGNLVAQGKLQKLPIHIQGLHLVTSRYSGPNCWNASLYTAKVLLHRRITTPSEMTYWTRSPLCRELAIAEAPQVGDIFAIRTNLGAEGFVELHGFAYLSKSLAFSKNGYHSQFPYEFVSPDHQYQIYALGKYQNYEANPACQRVYGQPSVEECPVYANVFRCRSYNEFVATAEFTSKSLYLNLDRQVGLFEQLVSEIIFSEKSLRAEHLVRLKQDLAGLARTYAETLRDDFELWGHFAYRFESLAEQLDLIEGGFSPSGH